MIWLHPLRLLLENAIVVGDPLELTFIRQWEGCASPRLLDTPEADHPNLVRLPCQHLQVDVGNTVPLLLRGNQVMFTAPGVPCRYLNQAWMMQCPCKFYNVFSYRTCCNSCTLCSSMVELMMESRDQQMEIDALRDQLRRLSGQALISKWHKADGRKK